jgi:hypothetical protein
MTRALAVPLLLLLLAAAAVMPGTARADGDPASDVLLQQDAYYPYTPNQVSAPVKRAMDGMLRQVRAKGFGMKVALISAGADLGAYPRLLGAPQQYADLLTREISLGSTPPRVLVVLPTGLGGNNLGERAGKALSGVGLPEGSDGDALARTAMRAIGALATANRTPVAVPAIATQKGAGNGGGGVPSWLVFAVPFVVVLLAVSVLSRRGGDEDRDAEEEGSATAA